MFTYAAPSILGLISLAGIIYSIVDMVKNDRQRKFLWIIALLIIPFCWIVYLLMVHSLGSSSEDIHNSSLPQSADSSITSHTFAEADAQKGWTVPGHDIPYSPFVNTPPMSKQMKAFRTVGTVLGVIALAGGILVVGAVIFFVLAFQSYGSNK